MSGYSWVSVVSIFCYLFLLMTFASSNQKSKKVIRTFIGMLAVMILWNGGSLGMRLQIWPSVNFWHHVSLLGIFMSAFGYYQFLEAFLDEDGGYVRYVLAVFFFGVFICNLFTGVFIPLPEVITVLLHYPLMNWKNTQTPKDGSTYAKTGMSKQTSQSFLYLQK